MGTKFDAVFVTCFFRWGLIAHKFRLPLLVVPFLLTAFLSIGLYWIKEQTTIDPQFVFSPEDAQWRYERAILSEHWPLDEQHFWPGKSYDYHGYVDVIAVGREEPEFGRPNMLLPKYINELERINKFILHNITVPVDHGGKHYEVAFSDLCMSYEWKCYENDHITMLQPKSKWGTFKGEIADLARDIIATEVKITYPIGWRGTEPIYFAAFVGAPHLTDAEGHFDYVKGVRLTYNVRDGPVANISYVWRKKLASFLANKETPPSDLLEFGFYHNESLPEGLQDVADALTPKFAMTSAILFTFCLAFSIVLLNHSGFTGIDWVRSKPLLGVAALVCPILAVVSTFGFLQWMGVLYNAIVNVSPFIVVCKAFFILESIVEGVILILPGIGVDDAFLMTAAWHRTNPELSVARRLAESLSEAAVAISITSMTDMLSFGIGCWTTLPGVRLFCMYTFCGITFTYIYQITYFTAIMAYAGEMEDKGRHALLGTRALQPQEADTRWKRWLLSGSVCRREEKKQQNDKVKNPTDDSKGNAEQTWSAKMKRFITRLGTAEEASDRIIQSRHGSETFVNRLFREYYGPSLLTNKIKAYVAVCYVLYISCAIYGLSQIKEGLNPKNLVRRSFYLSDFYTFIDETFWVEGLQLQVVVNKVPDFFNQTQRDHLYEMIHSFENTEYTMDRNATLLWLDAFEAKLKDDEERFNVSLPSSSFEWYQRCREWLRIAGGRRLWELDMDWHRNESNNERERLKAFRFQVGLRNYRTPTDHTNSCKLMREIASRFPEFNVTTFHEYYPFADQYLELKPALYRNCALAVICMLVVSLVMIPSVSAAFAIVSAIISIDMGVLGYMTLWGVNLESVSMITVIMSIGFSVDLSAHITYAYVKSHGDSYAKAIGALETLGWPVFLGAFSTVVGIMVLTLVDAYIVQIFFKTVFLVISFSLLHGIVFLPVLLTVALPARNDAVEDAKNQSKKVQNSQAKPKELTSEETAMDHISVDSSTLSEIDLKRTYSVPKTNKKIRQESGS